MNWRDYEAQIAAILQAKFPECTFVSDERIVGRITSVERQCDITARGSFLGREMFGVVECKCLGRAVDVPLVEAFAGFLEDVGANVGFMITTKGFSQAAKESADFKKIQLEIVEYQYLDEYEFEWNADVCDVCASESRPPGVIYWDEASPVEDGGFRLSLGKCDRCDTVHVRCETCGSVSEVLEGEYGKDIECGAGCVTFRAYGAGPRGDGESVEIIEYEEGEEDAATPHQLRLTES